jgi:hypothetical protein
MPSPRRRRQLGLFNDGHVAAAGSGREFARGAAAPGCLAAPPGEDSAAAAGMFDVGQHGTGVVRAIKETHARHVGASGVPARRFERAAAGALALMSG